MDDMRWVFDCSDLLKLSVLANIYLVAALILVVAWRKQR